ncbi:atlastin-2-like, partial [Hyalella azteca]|uniref:Atlastin-2-like n=1 Tax=Hyalella azteca TaxID=294128 RepID=A0A8B7MYZ1_HYAAZ
MSVLHRPEVRDTALCVVSIAGAFRKGKSFFMNCLLKYCMNKGSPDWLGQGEQLQPIGGFVWRAGMERETTGISIWSEPFLFTKSTGEKVAVILMDTQGTFDLETSAQESTFIFALTLLASSVTVYNLMNQIQEDDLMNLQTFSSYGVLAQENSQGTRSFQKLMFLVRDWSHPTDHAYGHKGGQVVLEKVLNVKEEQEPAHQRLRQGLRQSFEELECYLMPHIGLSASRNPNFKGHLEQLDPLFVEHLKLLVPRLLAPENLVVKRSCVTLGKPATADELVELFRTFIKFFNDGNLVQATSMVELMSRMASEAARKRALEVYREAMDSIIKSDGEDPQAAVLVEHHFESSKEALAVYAKENPFAKNCAIFPIADEIREELKS